MRVTFVGNFGVSYSSESHHAKTLEMLGHTVYRFQEGKDHSDTILATAVTTDLFVYIHTHGWSIPGRPIVDVIRHLHNLDIPTLTYHLDLWFGLNRQKDLENDPFYKEIGHFFTVDKLMADWFNQNTKVKGHYLPAAVFEPECVMLEPQKVDYDIIFVGSKGYHPEWPYRPQLINWLRQTYGKRFLHVGGDGDTGTVRGMELNQIYANAKVSIGDTLCLGFNYPYYFSDRIFEATGRGGFIIHPYIKGIDELFLNAANSGQEIAVYIFNDLDRLRNRIDFYLDNPEIREKVRLAGHYRTKKDHTYTNRWKTILETINA